MGLAQGEVREDEMTPSKPDLRSVSKMAPISRQREWQLKKNSKGLCEKCGKRPRAKKPGWSWMNGAVIPILRDYVYCSVCLRKQRA